MSHPGWIWLHVITRRVWHGNCLCHFLGQHWTRFHLVQSSMSPMQFKPAKHTGGKGCAMSVLCACAAKKWVREMFSLSSFKWQETWEKNGVRQPPEFCPAWERKTTKRKVRHKRRRGFRSYGLEAACGVWLTARRVSLGDSRKRSELGIYWNFKKKVVSEPCLGPARAYFLLLFVVYCCCCCWRLGKYFKDFSFPFRFAIILLTVMPPGFPHLPF